MSVLTSEGKVSDIFVSHDGIKKPVLSGWANQNGIPALFYKKGSGLPFETEEMKADYKKCSANSIVKQSSEFDVSNVKQVKIEGTVSAAKATSGASASPFNLRIVNVKEDGSETTVETTLMYVSGASKTSYNIRDSHDVSDWKGRCYVYLYNSTYAKYVGCNLTIILS